MPWVIQMLYFGLLLLGLGLALWVSFWVLIVLAIIGATIFLWGSIRAYLIEKGILNRTPGVAPQEPTEGITIEADYKRVDSE